MHRLADNEVSGLEGRRGAGSSQNVNEALTKLATERSRRDSISYGDALHQVCSENPDLARASRRAVLREPAVAEITGVSDELARKAMARAKAAGIDYAAALSEVGRENPELARAYGREILREDSD